MPSHARNATSQQTKLPSGLSLVVRPMAHAESVAVGVWIKVGGRYERATLSGISHMLEHLLFKGTRTRSCEQLTQAIEGIGGSLNAFTAEEFTCYMAKVPAKHLDRALAVLSDMVLHPAFKPDDMEKEREVILEEIRMYEDAPAQYVHDLFNQLLWPNHPLGNLLSGTMATVRGITRRDVVAHWGRFYRPRNMLIACAGALDPDRVLRRLRRAFVGRQPGLASRVAPAPRAARGPQVRLHHKETEQTHLCLGTPAMPRTHPQRFALELVHVLLGANMSSRLFHEVREKRGLVYDIGTQIKRYHDTGAFIISAGCDAAKLTTTIRTVIEELRRIKRQRVGPQELRRAKDFYAGQLLMGLEDTMDHMLWMGEQAVTVGRIADAHDVITALERVPPEQIRRAARALFTPERCYLTAIGPVPEEEADVLRTLCRP